MRAIKTLTNCQNICQTVGKYLLKNTVLISHKQPKYLHIFSKRHNSGSLNEKFVTSMNLVMAGWNKGHKIGCFSYCRVLANNNDCDWPLYDDVPMLTP